MLLLAACAPGTASKDPVGHGDTGEPGDSVPAATDSDPDTGGDETGEPAPDSADSGDSGDVASDADGDGFRVEDGDCDDERANVYPGAPDGCDGIDQDCDGEAIPVGACGERLVAEVSASYVVYGADERARLWAFSLGGNIDGSGRPSVFVARSVDSSYGCAVLAGGATLAPNGTDRDLPVWHSEYLRDMLGYGHDAGDTDGDGIDDVAFWSAASDPYYPGNLYLVRGRSTGWDAGQADIRDVADGWWTDEGDTTALLDALAGGDYDGDGLADLLVVTEEDPPSMYWRLLPGTTESLPYGAALSTLDVVLIDEDGGGSSVSYGEWSPLGDLDGDGYDEAGLNDATLFDGSGTHLLVEGEDLLAQQGNLSDVGQLAYFVSAAHAVTGIGFVENMELASDIDSDGLVDVAMTLYLEEPDGEGGLSCTSIVLGGALPVGDLAPREHARVCPPDDASTRSLPTSYPEQWIPDLDGDGLSDLRLRVDDDIDSRNRRRCVLRTGTVAAGGVYDDYDPTTMCFWDDDGYDPEFVDLTGDGLPEWVFSDRDYDHPTYGTDAGRVMIVEGFDIPFDDPSKW